MFAHEKYLVFVLEVWWPSPHFEQPESSVLELSLSGWSP